MAGNDVKQIKIDGTLVGIIGLDAVIEEIAVEFVDRSDADIAAEMVARLSRNIYIPAGERNNYGKAFVREFKKFIGKPVDEEDTGELDIKVLGAGCFLCNGLEEAVLSILTELKIAAAIDRITDINEIGSYGALATPALIINGEVAAMGSVPSAARLRELIKKYAP